MTFTGMHTREVAVIFKNLSRLDGKFLLNIFSWLHTGRGSVSYFLPILH